MSELKVKGYVYYQPGPWGTRVPLQGASVEIYKDKPGRQDDLLWRGITDGNGYFSRPGFIAYDSSDQLSLVAKITKGTHTIPIPFPYKSENKPFLPILNEPLLLFIFSGLCPNDSLNTPFHSDSYMIICPTQLLYSIRYLVEQKQSRGYRLLIKTVEDFGTPADPNKMRDCVLQKMPRYLLLVGDHDTTPSYRYNDITGDVYDSDNYFGMRENDIFPGVLIGRLSSSDQEMIERICRTLVEYPADPSPLWKKRVLLSGICPHETPYQDQGQDNHGWRCIEEIGTYFDRVLEYQNETRDNTTTPQQRLIWGTEDSTLESLIAEINRGVSILSYYGHGEWNTWFNVGQNQDGIDDNFTIEHVDLIDCEKRLPLVLSIACITGDIQRDCLAEAFHTKLKAIGVLASDVSSDFWWNERILPRILREIVTNENKRVGDILIGAMKKVHIDYDGAVNFPLDHMCAKHARFYRYLGDPDTILTVPEDNGIKRVSEAIIGVHIRDNGMIESDEVWIDFGANVRRAWATLSSTLTGIPIVSMKVDTEIRGSRVKARIVLSSVVDITLPYSNLRQEIAVVVFAIV